MKIMRLLFIVFIALFCMLQYKLWSKEGGILNIMHVKKEIAQQQRVNTLLAERNQKLIAKVQALKKGNIAVEEVAREELGMIKKGETYYQLVE
jgi:cell division protein FtsB